MIPRSISRAVKTILFLLLSAAAAVVYQRQFAHLPRATYITGWVLLGSMLVLTLYNGRKKIPFLPLLSSRSWLQFHIYAGYFTGFLFLAHVRFRMPTGWFEGSLSLLYWLVMFSGIIGLIMSRSFPKRLTTRGGEVVFEQVPVVRRNLQERAEAIALKSISDAKASTLADFYVSDLAEFFSGPKNFWLHVFEVRGPLNRLLGRIEDLNRFLNERERASLAQIADLVRQKDGLDYHHSLQLALKLWLFVHIPLTYSLLILSLLHLVLVYAFSGGA